MRTPITSTKLLIHTLQQGRTQDLKLGGAGDKQKKKSKKFTITSIYVEFESFLLKKNQIL